MIGAWRRALRGLALSERPWKSRLAGPFGLAVCAVFAACGQSSARGGPGPAEVNLALGKTYTLTPTPSYHLCTDPGDYRQLTDGRAEGVDWRKKPTVGWSYAKADCVVVIDLERVEPVEEVRVHSVGGGRSGVFYPAAILVMVSDDNRTYHAVGAADNVGLHQQRVNSAAAPRNPHVFRIGNLATRGRFVLILLEIDGAYLFTDETEVIRGGHDPQRVTFAADNRFRRGDVATLVPVLHERLVLSAVRQWFETAMPNADDPTKARWAQLCQESAAPRALYDMREVRRLASELYALRGRRLQSQRRCRLDWAVANPMEQVGPASVLPDPARRREGLELRCWQGEYESAAITLLNCGQSDLRLDVSVSPLRERRGASYPAEDCVTLRQAVMVRSRSLGPIGDALVKLGDAGLTLPAGRTGQLWLTFHNPELQSGEYEFVIRITPRDEADPVGEPSGLEIAGRLTVDPLTFPERPALKTCNWSYVRRGPVTAPVASEALADLRAHYVNVFVLVSTELPLPARGRDGRIRFDFNAHAETLRLYAAAEQYLFYWGRSSKYPDFKHLPDRLSPEWKTVMKAWLERWVAFLAEQGIGYDQFAMYPFDEYIGDEFYELARFIKEEVNPRIRIYANSRGDRNRKQMTRVAPYVDIWCLGDRPAGIRHPRRERLLRGEAATWTYSATGPSKAQAPHAYYRLQMWRAFARGDTGCGFWAYSAHRPGLGNIWDDHGGKAGPYDVVYGQRGCPIPTSGEALIPSRRWEAWREGVEDHEYLVRLRDAIETARKSGRAAEADRAAAIQSQTIRNVTLNHGSPDETYRARRLITELILDLE